MLLAALVFVAGCSKSVPNTPTTAPADAAAEPIEKLDDVPAPNAVGPLVPWMPASAWNGQGVPPKQFSLYTVPTGSPVLGYAALERDACEDALRKRNIAFMRAEDTPGVRAPV